LIEELLGTFEIAFGFSSYDPSFLPPLDSSFSSGNCRGTLLSICFIGDRGVFTGDFDAKIGDF